MLMVSTQSKSNNTLIAKRNYTFDAVGRVAIRTQTRGTNTARNDSFGYNDRSELTSAVLGTDDFAYSFDNIGNRMTAKELSDEIAYSANNLNQYTAIEKNSGMPFVPTFDDDGNQLTVQTATGVWNVTYNAENRPITFTSGTTVIERKYDSQGRRFEKEVTANGAVTFWQSYAYKGYLQIAAFNVSIVDETEILSLATTTYWDPTEPTATRPLAFTDHTVATPATYFYTHDLTKSVCEILSRNDTAVSIVTTYDYTPFGAVTASNSSTPNTFCFSSEVLDPETSLVYYNYRHYNPTDGRWINRDPKSLLIQYAENDRLTIGGKSHYFLFCNQYLFAGNNPYVLLDTVGMDIYLKEGNLDAGWLNNIVHQNVCVDTWDCLNTSTPKKRNVLKCYSFGKSGYTFRLGARLTWLGWSDYVLGGFLMKGEIYEARDTGRVIRTKKTTPTRDVIWAQWMEKARDGNEDIYSVARHNCRKYSQQEFANA